MPHFYIKINTIQIKASTPGVSEEPYPWKGIYFKDIPISLTAIPAAGYRFSHWEGDYNSTDSIITITSDADSNLKAHFINTEEQHLLNFWMFDRRIPNDLPLEEIPAVYSHADVATLYYQSCLPGYPYDPSHEYWRIGSLERRNNPTALNYRMEGNNHIPYDNSDMLGIQVKQPLAHGERESELIFHLPATRVKDLVFSFAATDDGAADALVVDYSVDGASNWTNQHLVNYYLPLTNQYILYEIDFSHIDEINGNPDFFIRIRFSGNNLYNNNGKSVTFNNFSLDGVVCMAYKIHIKKYGPGSVIPAENVNMVKCGSQKFILTPLIGHVIGDLTLDGVSKMDEVIVKEEHVGEFVLHNPSADHELMVFFEFDPFLIHEYEDLIIYPNPSGNYVNIASKSMVSRIEIFDLKGNKVFTAGFTQRQIELDLSHMLSGLYIIIVTQSDGVASRKLQILRE